MTQQNVIHAAAAQLDIRPGRPDLNTAKIVEVIKRCRREKDDIVIFSEMAVPGYIIGDEWDNAAFVRDAYGYNDDIIAASRGIVVIWGNVDIDESKINEDGRLRKYNAAFVAQNGELIGKIHKTLLPKYREFEDARHFHSMRKEAEEQNRSVSRLIQPITVSIRNQPVKIGVTLCEDMWSDDYAVNPIELMLDHRADMIVNISCSPWTMRKNDKRHRVIRDRLKEHPAPFIYVNNIGIQNNGKNIYLFDGNSTVYNSDGSLHMMAKDYSEEIVRASISKTITRQLPPLPPPSADKDIQELYQGLLFGVRTFFRAFTPPRVVIGASGGIDSSLSAVLLALALGPRHVFAINMPSRFNSQTTISAAEKLARNLGIHYTSIPIQQSFEYTVRQLNNAVFERMDGSGATIAVELSDLNKENIQARDRGARILAGVASALGALFVNNGNKTEIALGYATLYGDVNGAIAILGDLYKTDVYRLARYINKIHDRELIPDECLTLPASAELSASQNVEQGKGDPINYPYHDKLIRAFVEFRLDPEDILRLYLDGKLPETFGIDREFFSNCFADVESFIEDLEHMWKLFKISYFKRIQAPPIIAVTRRAFGFDLRESQNGVYFTRNYYRLKTHAHIAAQKGNPILKCHLPSRSESPSSLTP